MDHPPDLGPSRKEMNRAPTASETGGPTRHIDVDTCSAGHCSCVRRSRRHNLPPPRSLLAMLVSVTKRGCESSQLAHNRVTTTKKPRSISVARARRIERRRDRKRSSKHTSGSEHAGYSNAFAVDVLVVLSVRSINVQSQPSTGWPNAQSRQCASSWLPVNLA